MIEQLQSLMKALEAGSYNAQPQQSEPPVQLEFKITDKETGQVLHEGFVTSWSINISRDRGRKFSMEGIEMPKAIKIAEPDTIANTYLSRMPEQSKPQYFEKKHEHKWKTYEGFMETYVYCTDCNERRT